MIANPRVADISGRYNQGKDNERRRQLADIALANNQEDRMFKQEDRAIARENRGFALEDRAAAKATNTYQAKLIEEVEAAYNSGDTARQVEAMKLLAIHNPSKASAIAKAMSGGQDTATAMMRNIVASGAGAIGTPGFQKAMAKQLEGPESNNATSIQKDLAAAGFKPGTPEFEGALAKDIALRSATPLVKNLVQSGLKFESPELQSAIKKALTTPETPDEKDIFSQSHKIRSEITKASESYNKITDSYGRITAVAKDQSAAGDLALIFNFMKMLDPGSVVRESEFATAANSAGVPDRVRNMYNKVLSGERLAPDQRKDFIGRSKDIFDEADIRQKNTIDNFVSLAKNFGIAKEYVIVEHGRPGGVQVTSELSDPAGLRGQ